MRGSRYSLRPRLLCRRQRTQGVVDGFLVPVEPLAADRQVVQRHGLIVQTPLPEGEVQGGPIKLLRAGVLVFLQSERAVEELDLNGKVAVLDALARLTQ